MPSSSSCPCCRQCSTASTKWNGLEPLTEFVGLQNYITAFGNKAFQTSVGNNVLIVVLSLFIQIPFSLALAVLLNRRFRGRAILRLLFFLPVRPVRSGHGHRLHADAATGLGPRHVAEDGRPGGLIQDWLGDSTLVMVTLFVIISWKYFGFHMIIMLAGLQGIPKELEEAGP
jgi:raffinose/stachyose/melibiose transport system permease protein